MTCKQDSRFAEIVHTLQERERDRQAALAELRGTPEGNEPICGWSTFDEHTTTANQERGSDFIELIGACARVLDVLRRLSEDIGNTVTAVDVGCRFTCTEAEAIAAVMAEGGQDDAVARWLAGHAAGDDTGDLHHGLAEPVHLRTESR